MPFATRGDQTLRATARDSAYYLLRDFWECLLHFRISALVRFPPIGANSAAVRPAPRLLALVRIFMGEWSANLTFAILL